MATKKATKKATEKKASTKTTRGANAKAGKKKAPTKKQLSALMKKLVGYGKKLDLVPEKGEAEVDFQERILEVIDDIDAKGWKKMGLPMQKWYNSFSAEKAAEEAQEKTAEKKKVEEKKAAAKAKASKASKGKKSREDYIKQEWAEGSTAQTVLETLRTGGDKGMKYAEIYDALEALKKDGKFKSNNVKARAQVVLREAIKRQLATKDGGVWFAL